MAQVTSTVAVYVYISGAWTQLNDVAPIIFSWGISGNAPLDRLADTGELQLILDNTAGLYTPGGDTVLTGWKNGLPVKVVITYDGETYVRFRGYIADIEVKQSNKDKKAYVTVLDWMDYAARHTLDNFPVAHDVRASDVLQTVLDDMPKQPQAIQLDEGAELFETAFDAGGDKTRSYNEFAKVVFSELGYLYLMKDKDNGEKLRFESAVSRLGWRAVDNVPLSNTASGFALNENSDFELNENGDFVLLNQTAAFDFGDSVITNFEAPHGDHIINQAFAKTEPRDYDAAVVLFTQHKEIIIASGQTKKIRGTYANPNGGAPVEGQDMIDPVITTDYTMFTQTAGGGSNISSDLQITTKYGAKKFVHTITNNNAARGYINFFQCRGTGIYKPNPTEYVAEDLDSIADNDYHTITLNQAYKQDLDAGAVFADMAVADFSQPKIVLNSITFSANRSDERMMAALNTDVGHLRHIVISELNIDSNYYIQGIKFVMNGGLTTVEWIVQERPSLLSGWSPIAVDFEELNILDAVNFGHLPQVINLERISLSAWVYAESFPATAIIMQMYDLDIYGLRFYISSTGAPNLLAVDSMLFSTKGVWTTSADQFATGAWYHVGLTFDATTGAGVDPILYVNGSAPALTETSTPAGTRVIGEGTPLIIGNQGMAGLNGSFDGKIFDPRVYNRIVSAAEMTTLYNAGTPDETLVTSGLVFQGLCVQTGKLTDFVDVTLDDSYAVRDNIYGSVGRINGNPIGRAAP